MNRCNKKKYIFLLELQSSTYKNLKNLQIYQYEANFNEM
jgi:hypothetical protein